MNIGLLHPGDMGARVGAVLQGAGHTVRWLPSGRSQATHERARVAGLEAAHSLQALCGCCELILCICLPRHAPQVAADVIDQGFQGIYVDANAISPALAVSLAQRMAARDIEFVDGAITGPPPERFGTTRVFLSGHQAVAVAACFEGTALEGVVLGEEVGRASALKLSDSLVNKGVLALLYQSLAAAEHLGVRESLMAHWMRYPPRSTAGVNLASNRLLRGLHKAPRFADEMGEIAAALHNADLSSVLATGAQNVFARLAAAPTDGTLASDETVVNALRSLVDPVPPSRPDH